MVCPSSLTTPLSPFLIPLCHPDMTLRVGRIKLWREREEKTGERREFLRKTQQVHFEVIALRKASLDWTSFWLCGVRAENYHGCQGNCTFPKGHLEQHNEIAGGTVVCRAWLTLPPARLDILVASLSFLSHDILCFSKLHETSRAWIRSYFSGISTYCLAQSRQYISQMNSWTSQAPRNSNSGETWHWYEEVL